MYKLRIWHVLMWSLKHWVCVCIECVLVSTFVYVQLWLACVMLWCLHSCHSVEWVINAASSAAVSCRAVLCCAVPCCAVPCCAVQCRAVLCCAVSCRAVLCCAVPCCAVLCCAVQCRAVLCCAVLCCALCCAVSCRAVPCRAVHHVFCSYKVCLHESNWWFISVCGVYVVNAVSECSILLHFNSRWRINQLK